MYTVVGGGVSGLSAAYYLLKACANAKVVVAEAGPRIGGWIESYKDKSGLIFEQGPRTVRPRYEAGANTLHLVEELGLSDLVKGIPTSHPTAKNRMIYVHDKLHTLPSSLLQAFLVKAPFSRPLVSALISDLQAKSVRLEDESIYSFVERRFGREIADYAISPMICGICAGDAREISVKFLMKSVFEMEQKHGSVVKGLIAKLLSSKDNIKGNAPISELAQRAKKEKWSVWSLKGGLEVLPKSLHKKIESFGGKVHLNTPCSRILFNEKGVLLTIGGEEVQAQHVISTVTAHKLAPLLGHQHPFLSDELSKIPTVTVAVVNLAYKGNVLKHDAFGFLIPPSEGRPILGVIFDTCCFPQENHTVLTVMMGGRWFDSRLGKSASTEDILNVAVTQVGSILGIEEKPFSHHVTISKDCIPQYVVGHHERVQKIRNYVVKNNLPISLAGSAFDGVGVNDVILSAKSAALQATRL